MQIFRLIKKVLFLGLTILSNFTNALDCISMKNSECKVRPEIISINSNNPTFSPLSIKVHKCSGNCNDINDPYARIYVPNIVKNLKVKVFNIMSRTNETRFIEWHEKCKCICRLHKIICNNKQKWNKDKCRCECKELIDGGVCNKICIWNPSICECECKCRKKLTDKLIDECTKTIEETKLVNVTFNENENNYECGSCIFYTVLMTIAFTIFTGITVYLVY